MNTQIRISLQAVPWWLVLLQAILSIFIGIVVLSAPGTAMLVIVRLLGLYWLIKGIFSLTAIFHPETRHRRGWLIFSSALGIVAGLAVLDHPTLSAIFLPAVLVIFVGLTGDTAVQHAMNRKPPMRVTGWISMAMLVTLFTGCSSWQKRTAPGSPDRAYVAYWPPAKDEHRLRLAVKDIIDMKGVVTTAGSGYFAKNNPPAARDAKCLAIARERNVKIVGKTNLSELALGVSGINSYFGTPRNRVAGKPWIIPGGSSSGDAVAIADESADIAFGTDTGGSIRVPAACCGIAGLKTTFGLISLEGVHPVSPKYLDTVGPMAKDVAHLVQGMDLLQRGFAGRYASAVAARPSARGIRIGRLYVDGTDPKIDRAVDDILAAKGFKVVVMNKTFKSLWEQAEKDGDTVASASGWLSDGQYFGKSGISGLTDAVLALGAIEFNTRYPAALKRRAEWQRTLRRVFRKVDFIALPTLKTLPPRVPFWGGSPAFEALVLAKQGTVAVNFAGNPALALPIPVQDKTVPVTSLQLVGPRLSESQLLNAGRLIEVKR